MFQIGAKISLLSTIQYLVTSVQLKGEFHEIFYHICTVKGAVPRNFLPQCFGSQNILLGPLIHILKRFREFFFFEILRSLHIFFRQSVRDY